MFTMRTDSTHLGPHEGHSAPGLHVLAKPIGPVCDLASDRLRGTRFQAVEKQTCTIEFVMAR
jgi:hypothetical protein